MNSAYTISDFPFVCLIKPSVCHAQLFFITKLQQSSFCISFSNTIPPMYTFKTLSTSPVQDKFISIDLVMTLGMQTQSADVFFQYSIPHVKFVHLAAQTPNSDKLCNNFRAAGTNRCLDFNLSLLAACDSVSWSCRM